MKKKRWGIIVGSALVLFVAALAFGSLVQAAPQFRPLQALLGTSFTYQGYLEDGGTPANGTYDLRFSLWDDSSVGSQVGSDVVKVGESVEDGLFTVELDFGDVFDGTELWLKVEVKVPSDPDYTALSPRQALTAVPYAHYALNIPDHDHWGESWSGSGVGLDLTSTNGSAFSAVSQADDGTAIWGIANGAGGSTGISGSSNGSNGQGVAGFASSSTGFAKGVYGFSASSSGFGVFGFAPSTGNHGVGGESQAVGGRGVAGTAWRMDQTGVNYGVYGRSNSSDGFGGFFVNLDNSGAGILLAANDHESTDDLEFFVSKYGNVYADGTYSSPASDFAEMLPGGEDLEPADVLVIDLDGKLVRSTTAYQANVMGVFSTQPGFLGGAGEGSDLIGKVPLAIMGVVPVKASAENGAIQPGDMLVASDTPGYAMRAGENPSVGTILGKALEPLESGLGVIQILVMLQ